MSERSPAERSDKAPLAAAQPADPSAPEQHSIGRSVVLHLLPGALITLFFALTAPVARGLGCCASSPTASRRLRSYHDFRDLVARLAEESFPRQVDLVAAGYLHELQARIDWSQEHKHLIEP